MKLLIDIFRKESYDAVFCGLNFIGVIVSVWIFLPLLASKGQIGDDHTFIFIFLLSFPYFSSLLQLLILDFRVWSTTLAAGFLEEMFFPCHCRKATWSNFPWHLVFLSKSSFKLTTSEVRRVQQSKRPPKWWREELRCLNPRAASST